MFNGTKITVDGEDFIVPPLSLGQLRNGTLSKLKQHDDLLAEGKTWEAMILRGEIILEALHRNYPSFEPERLYAWLDVGNCGPIWLAILGASGFTPGETQAARAADNGTSVLSIGALPPLMDGPTSK